MSPADLIAPRGALTSDLLLGLDAGATALATAGAYLAAAEERVATWTGAGVDRATIAYATHRALSDRAQQILSGAMSASADGDGSESFSTSQAVELRKEAAVWLQAFMELEAAELAPTPALPPALSRSTAASFAW